MQAPFYIENRTADTTVRVQQKGSSLVTVVPPRQTLPFAFELPTAEKILVLRMGETEVEYPMTFAKVRPCAQWLVPTLCSPGSAGSGFGLRNLFWMV